MPTKIVLRWLVFLGLASSTLAGADRGTGTRPNILIAIADDWGLHAGSYSTPWVKTPAFDRVAREGLLFTHAYTPNAKCAPSRACLLTGRNPWQLEAAANHVCYFPPKFKGWMEALAEKGWHVGHTQKGWGPGVATNALGHPRQMTGPAFNRRKAVPPASGISHNDYAANFEDFLDAAPAGSPWCFWYGAVEPHRGYEFGSGVAKGAKQLADVGRVPAYWPDDDRVRHDILDYAFEVEHFDRHLGRMLASLERRGLLENTLVVVTSDHGMPFPRVKGNTYEAANHVPFAAMWKGGIRAAGRVIDDYVSFIDVAPTLLEVAEVSWESTGMAPVAGRSFADVFRSSNAGRVDASRDRVLLGRERTDVGRPNDWGYPVRAIVKAGQWYVQNFEPSRWPAGNPETGYLDCDGGTTKSFILDAHRRDPADPSWALCFGKRPVEEHYDLSDDPDCVTNLATRPDRTAERTALRTELFAALTEQDDPRMRGDGDVFDRYPYAHPAQRNFHGRYLGGEAVKAGWVSETDFEPRPNVIVILSDDQGAADAGCYGATDLETPALDSLAGRGVRFTQFYSAAPVCSPSRAGLLTGRYPWLAGMPGNSAAPPVEGENRLSGLSSEGLPAEETTLAEMFLGAGYATAHIGKWHLGYGAGHSPLDQGFQESFGHMGGCIDNYTHFFYWAGPNRHDLWKNGERLRLPGRYFPDLMIDEARDFIGRHRERPFFLYYAMNLPHYPYQGEPKWLGRYRELPYPRNLYAAFVSTLDERVGRLLGCLDEFGLRERTIIVYQSDNGHSVEDRAHGGGGSSGPYRGAKFSLFEGGIRLPAVISWPGRIPEGAVRGQMAHASDWLPTLAELAGVAAPEGQEIHGRSLVPVLHSPDAPSPHEVLHWRSGRQWAVRQGPWKLIHEPQDPTRKQPMAEEDRPWFLSNLNDDPGERVNLAARHPGKVTELRELAVASLPEAAAFRRAKAHAETAAEAFERCRRYVNGWLAHADPESGLIPRNLRESRDFWNGRDAAADNYAFMVLTAALTDRPLLEGRMLQMLRSEQRLTARRDRLCDDYSFSQKTWRREPFDLAATLFDSAEYVKDGLLPVIEWLGPSPWSERAVGLVEDIWKNAAVDTPAGRIPTLNFEVNGDLLQAGARLFWLTGERRFLDQAERLGDYYLLGTHHPTRDLDRLRLRDHGGEVVNGLTELYFAMRHHRPAKAEEYRRPLRDLLDGILDAGRNPHGLLYDWFRPATGEHSTGVCDTWGYVFDGFYTMHLLDQVPAYRDAVRLALGALEPHYTGYRWEGDSADGYADAIESALNLYHREPVQSAARWLDTEIRVLWSKQQPDGVIEGWHGDGNFARTSLMYALWKTQGIHLEPWRPDVRVGAERQGDSLFIHVGSDRPWTGRLVFDRPRHRLHLHLPADYPRINQFPEWYTAGEHERFVVEEPLLNRSEAVAGNALCEGLEVSLEGGETRWLLVRRVQGEP